MKLKLQLKPETPPKAAPDTPVEINSRIRNGSLRQLNYKDFAPLFGYAEAIDNFLEKLFKGEIDLGNGNVCDNMIDDIAEQAAADIELQRISHHDSINTISNQRIADRHAYKRQLEKKKEELAEIRGRLDEINIRFRKSKFRKELKNA
jgi:hypothetical protein